MKTIIISFALILFLSITTVNAQNSRPSFALLGGVSMQNLVGKDNNGDKLTNDMIIGYHVGINIDIPIAPQFYFEPGLLFSAKGAENSYGSLTGTYHLSYIEMPLNVVYKGALGNGFVMVGFGPYIAFAIGGKSTIENGNSSLDKDIVFQKTVEDGDDYLTVYAKRFDAGGNIFAGYQMAGGLFFQLDTQFGMLKINPEDLRTVPEFTESLAIKNIGFGLTLGYRF